VTGGEELLGWENVKTEDLTRRSGLRCYFQCPVGSELSVVRWVARRFGRRARPVASVRVLQAYPVASPVADSVPVCTSKISLHRSFLPNLEGGCNRGSPLTYVSVEH